MANNFADYYYVKVKARATVDGTPVRTTAISITYALDDIPSATLDIAVGRRVNPEALGEVSASEGLITTLEPFTPVEIYLTLTPTNGRGAPAGKPLGFPEGEFLAFTGYVSSVGCEKRSMGGIAALQISACGQPVTLAGSSQLISGMIEPSAAQTGAKPIVCKFGNSDTARPSMFEALKNAAPDVLDDIWDSGIQVLMEQMVARPDAWSGEEEENTNDFAKIGLDRINLDGALPTQPLSLADYAVDPAALSEAIQRTLVNVLYMNWSGYSSQTNLWTALVALRDHFYFHFVPAVSEDAIAPITFALGGEPEYEGATLDPSEYYLIKSSVGGLDTDRGRFYSYMGSVALTLEGGGLQPSPWQSEDMVAKPLGFASIALPEGAKGRFHMLPAPAWLLPPGTPGKVSLSFDGGYPDASNPEATGDKETEGEAATQAAMEDKILDSGLGNAVAESVLMDNLFEHRRMTIAGRVRFDISPGSLLRINTIGEKFTGESDILYGHVMAVSIEIGEVAGGDSYARTVFELGHIRSKTEHDTLTVEAHPLYNVPWVGGKLVDF